MAASSRIRSVRRELGLVKAVQLVCDYTSMHGFVWHNRTSNPAIRNIISAILFAVLCGLPVIIFTEFFTFIGNQRSMTSVEMMKFDNFSYPNITVCHPRYFDKRRLQDYEISDDLAAYMTLALVSRTQNDTYMLYLEKKRKDWLVSLDQSLMKVMEQGNFDNMVDLFKAVAIRCTDFIFMCDNHGQILGTDPTDPTRSSCCEEIFAPEPFFTPMGTCFALKTRPLEYFPAAFNSIKVWLNELKEYVPATNMYLQGSDATKKNGAFWAISDMDLLIAALYQKPRQIPSGAAIQVGLTAEMIDRSQSPVACEHKNESFESIFGVASTKMNCQLMMAHFLHADCSPLVYAGLPRPTRSSATSSFRPCMPSDTTSVGTIKLADLPSLGAQCNEVCQETVYEARVDIGYLDMDVLNRFLREVMNRQMHQPSSVMSIEFFFETFDFERKVLFTDSVLTFLSRIGGWMGFALGASMISFIELICFFGFICKIVCSKMIARESST